MSFRKMAGFAGIAFIVLIVASFIAYGSPPSPSATAADVVTYIQDTGGYLVGGLLGALSVIVLIPFGAGFAAMFFGSDREHGAGYGVVIVAAFVAAVATIGAALAALTTAGLWVDDMDPLTVKALWDLSNVGYAFSILLVIPAAAAAAIAIMRHEVMPRWFGYLSGVVAILALSGIPAFLTNGDGALAVLVGFIAMMVWVLTASILMVRESV